jgi:hypothetical protein
MIEQHVLYRFPRAGRNSPQIPLATVTTADGDAHRLGKSVSSKVALVYHGCADAELRDAPGPEWAIAVGG